ncbi:hypothetical protein CVT26_015545 [Gymnopilus dilepis]|uniref:Uncharacterized protein n=1 Tax=Gymnopilus dilepis TaxID=231916 RepID=A0A409YD42_9AGAR|nr:hypothetical protein CVT26_015545 [Gymnopilus dilepis]
MAKGSAFLTFNGSTGSGDAEERGKAREWIGRWWWHGWEKRVRWERLGRSEPSQALFGPEGETKHVASRRWLTRFSTSTPNSSLSLPSGGDAALIVDIQYNPPYSDYLQDDVT